VDVHQHANTDRIRWTFTSTPTRTVYGGRRTSTPTRTVYGGSDAIGLQHGPYTVDVQPSAFAASSAPTLASTEHKNRAELAELAFIVAHVDHERLPNAHATE
jgi:hypothetical protein